MPLPSPQDANGAPGRDVPGQAASQASGPVIVLAFRFSGGQVLESILSRQPGLTCTTGTGIVPLCAQALATWQQVETAAAMSALAASSVRALAGSMITCILASAGGTRWCETVTGPASSANTFARLFPQAQFVCVYRSCDQAVSAATQVSRWGLASAGVGEFAGAYPGNNVAAVTAYWRASTSEMLEFEAAHSSRTLRVRYEDLTASPDRSTQSLLNFLGLAPDHPGLPGQPPAGEPGADPPPGLSGSDSGLSIPLELIPAPMLERVNDLQTQLGYPALRAPRVTGSPSS
jgi:protein-tyrosine sulfotransferase